MNFPPPPPANQSDFDFTLSDPITLDNQRRKQRRGRQLGLLMALLLLALLAQGLFQRERGYTAAEATRLDKIEQALQDTKPIYGERAENGLQSLNHSPQAKPMQPSAAYQKEMESAINKWLAITMRKGAHPSDWRRLGLVQAIFNRPEALQTFQKLPLLYAQHKVALDAKPKVRKPKKKNSADAETDEALIWTPKIPPAQEAALWAAIYGKNPIDAKQIPALRAQALSLELQWFEPVALTDLYAKANLRTESRHAEEAALTSVHYLVFFDSMETNVRLLSFPAVFFFFGWFLRKRNLDASSRPALPPYGTYPGGYDPVLRNIPPPKIPDVYSYHARMVAFVAYMGLPLVIFLPLYLVSGPLHALSNEAKGRLEALLEIGGSLLIAFIAVLVLRRVDASDRDHGVDAAPRPSLRDTLYNLGYRSRAIPGDIATGLVGWPALFLPLLVASLVSMQLFSRFETPPHPILISIAGLHTPLDRALLFIESAIIPPLVEELMFRGLLYPALRERWGVAGGVILSAAIFALVHPTLPGGFLPLWAMGAVWAFTYERRGSLLPSILMHALNNGLLIALEMSALSN